MLAKKPTGAQDPADEYTGLIPDRMVVLNEVTVLLVLQKEQRWMTSFELEVGVAKMRGDESRSVQLTGGLKQLLSAGLLETATFPDPKTKRKVAKYALTEKGEQSAALFHQLFTLMK